MGLFRKALPRPQNPADGREYDEMHLPNPCYSQKFSVFWTGKTLDYDATNARLEVGDLSRVLFTDGSWASLYTGECHNAGAGELAVSGIDANRKPW